MLYFSFEVKMEGPKEKWGPKEKVEGGGQNISRRNYGPSLSTCFLRL